MKKLFSLSLCAVTCVTLLAAFGGASTSWWDDSVEWDLARLAHRLAEENRRGEVLASRTGVVRRCTEGKREVTLEVIAGRLTLPEAAERFRELHETRDEGYEDSPPPGPDHRDEEAMCLNVIVWVAAELHENPPRARVVVSRLEDELRDRLPSRSGDGL